MATTELDLIRRLARDVDSTAVCDADKSTRVMASAIQARSAGRWMCGPAFTVRCRDDFFGVVRAIEAAAPGDVVVVDGGGREVAYAGELFARAAQVRGLAGIVVDGGYRDMTYVAACPLPVYSRHVTPMAGGTGRLGELGMAVTCGGVTVSPGDVVLADAEGIIVLDPGAAPQVLRAAATIKETEARSIALLGGGGTLATCLNVAEHQAGLEEGRPTALRFTV